MVEPFIKEVYNVTTNTRLPLEPYIRQVERRCYYHSQNNIPTWQTSQIITAIEE